MLKKLSEKQAVYTKTGPDGQPTLASTEITSSEPTKKSSFKMPQSPKVKMKSVMMILGLALFFVVGLSGIMIAQRQQNNRGSVAPTAPESQPAAASTVDANSLPWTAGGPTAAWEDPVNNKTAVCNQKYCWVFNVDTSGKSVGTWDRGGAPMDISIEWQSSPVAPDNKTRIWSNGGPDAGWLNNIANEAAVCSGKYCWTYDINTGDWKKDAQGKYIITDVSSWPLRAGSDNKTLLTGGKIGAAWTDLVLNNVALCNGNNCWVYNINDGTFANNGAPAVNIAKDWEATGKIKAATDGTKLSQGPTAAWTNPYSYLTAVCRNKWCWLFDQKTGVFTATPIDISSASQWANSGLKTYAQATTTSSACEMVFTVAATPPPVTPTPTYSCNSDCTTDAQCKTANANFVCATISNGTQKCRYEGNTTSGSCQPPVTPTPTYSCNSDCTTDAQCKTANQNFVCATISNGTQKCRYEGNTTSGSCQPPTGGPTYSCNSDCTSDAQCKTANENFVCATISNGSQKCRYEGNTTSGSCQPPTSPTPSPTPAPVACNESCETDEQCQETNASYFCSPDHGNVCRLANNAAAQDCQPAAETYACDSTCSTDADCETINSDYTCASTSDGNRCRLSGYENNANCQEDNPPPRTPEIGCNEVCSTNADCSNTNHICVTTADGTNRCRLDTYPNSSYCTPPDSQVVTTPGTPSTPVEYPEELPQSGADDWVGWLKAGLITLGIGAALLLLL